MPIYEYRCEKCGDEFEELVMGSDPEVRCPRCESDRVCRRMSAASFKTGSKFSSSAGGSCAGCSSTTCSTCH
jgi:putative FmdB family regulatory protein